jgi:hypothetical protein
MSTVVIENEMNIKSLLYWESVGKSQMDHQLRKTAFSFSPVLQAGEV